MSVLFDRFTIWLLKKPKIRPYPTPLTLYQPLSTLACCRPLTDISAVKVAWISTCYMNEQIKRLALQDLQPGLWQQNIFDMKSEHLSGICVDT